MKGTINDHNFKIRMALRAHKSRVQTNGRSNEKGDLLVMQIIKMPFHEHPA